MNLKRKEMSHVFIIEIYTLQQSKQCKELVRLKEKEKKYSGILGIFILLRMKAAKAKDI